MRIVVAALVLIVAVGVVHGQTPGAETVGEIRVHGNHTTPDEVVLTLAGLAVGSAVTEATIEEAEERLRQSGRFAGVEIRKRYRSIDNPSDILIILLVDERAAVSDTDLTPGPLKRIRSVGMWLPIVDYADGYGFTYGGRVSFVDALGPRSRVSVPATWGGERRAAVEVDRTFERGPLTRVEGSASVTRRVNPHYEIADTRRQVAIRAERALTSWLRVGGGAREALVSFGGADRWQFVPGVDLIVDTRIDPAFPRNAIHAIAGIEQLRFHDSARIRRWSGDLRGYVGLIGPSVLALRVTTSRASATLPLYEQALLGGTATLRGYEFGYRAGDNLAAASAELRVPLTSPLHMGRFGVKGFVDAGTVYDAGAKLSDRRFDRGIGGGLFFTATVVRAGLDVAWPNDGSGSPRWHFGLGVTF